MNQAQKQRWAVVPALGETKAGGSLQPRSRRPAWLTRRGPGRVAPQLWMAPFPALPHVPPMPAKSTEGWAQLPASAAGEAGAEAAGPTHGFLSCLRFPQCGVNAS